MNNYTDKMNDIISDVIIDSLQCFSLTYRLESYNKFTREL